MMTRKHFEAIAAAVRDAQGVSGNTGDDLTVERATLHRVAHALADACRRENPQLDRGRFLRACGVED